MEPVGWQLVIKLVGGRVLCPGPAHRRALARTVLVFGEDRGLLAFGAADTHLHVLTTGNRETAGRLARSLELALHSALGVATAFRPAEITPINDQYHLVNAFRYVQRNAQRHCLADLAASEASSLHDLLGMRQLAPWLGDRVRRFLPRTDRQYLLRTLGLPDLGVKGEPTPGLLADAAAASVSHSTLTGSEPMVVCARTAAVSMVSGRWKPVEVSRALGISVRGVYRLAEQEADPNFIRAIERHLAWREALRSAPDPLLDPDPG